MSELVADRTRPALARNLRRLAAVALGGVLVAAAAVMPRPAAAADVDVGVSIGISRPGVYGRIDIGRYPAPVLVSPTPVWVAPPPVVVYAPPQPVALWVPPGHRKNWRKHCHRYGACGVPVVFVQDRWYHDHGPGHRHRADDRRWERGDREGRGPWRDRGRGKDRDD
jgi:hypothetical protein